MAAKLKSVRAISLRYILRGPHTLGATDDGNDDKWVSKDDADLRLLMEVFTKVALHSEVGGDIKLMIEDDQFIVPDPAFAAIPKPGS